MSLANYSDIKTAVENWLDRSDLTARIPEFITLAEARIKRKLRVRGIIERSYTSMISGQAYYALPSDFLECRNVQINSSPKRVLSYRTPEQLDFECPDQTTAGTPKVYSLIGLEIQLAPTPSTTDTLEIAYYQKLPALSDGNPTNWLTSNAQDLLLYGALLEAEAYLVNDPRIPLWKSAFDQSMDEWNLQERRGRFTGSALMQRNDSSNP